MYAVLVYIHTYDTYYRIYVYVEDMFRHLCNIMSKFSTILMFVHLRSPRSVESNLLYDVCCRTLYVSIVHEIFIRSHLWHFGINDETSVRNMKWYVCVQSKYILHIQNVFQFINSCNIHICVIYIYYDDDARGVSKERWRLI